MSANLETARQFFDACETGKGWEGCQEYCHPDATFTAQAATLDGISTLAEYCDWMQGLFTPVPDARYELKGFAQDPSNGSVMGYGVLHGTQSGPGGPVPPTGNTIVADYVYHMTFSGDRISHMTKIWNDGASMQQMGWA